MWVDGGYSFYTGCMGGMIVSFAMVVTHRKTQRDYTALVESLWNEDVRIMREQIKILSSQVKDIDINNVSPQTVDNPVNKVPKPKPSTGLSTSQKKNNRRKK